MRSDSDRRCDASFLPFGLCPSLELIMIARFSTPRITHDAGPRCLLHAETDRAMSTTIAVSIQAPNSTVAEMAPTNPTNCNATRTGASRLSTLFDALLTTFLRTTLLSACSSNHNKWPQCGQGASPAGNDTSTQTSCPQSGQQFRSPSGVLDDGIMILAWKTFPWCVSSNARILTCRITSVQHHSSCVPLQGRLTAVR